MNILGSKVSRAVFGLALLILSGVPAGAKDRTLKLGYDVYLGGLNIFYLDVNLRMDGNHYEIFGGGETKGFARMMWRWAVQASAKGVVNGQGIESVTYDVATKRKGKDRKLRLTFSEDGAYSIIRSPKDSPDKRKSRKLPESIPTGTLDPISVSMAVASAAAKGAACGGKFPVFDGNRRYDLTFTSMGEEHLSKPGYSIFSGRAIRCSFAMKRISGFRLNRVALRFWDEARLEPPQVWLGRLERSLPLVPIQFQADFNMGYMIIYLSKAEYGNRPLLVPASQTKR
ncbi:MAG: DUF3108 domain-containing protein [Alphaproteobacteria bacterium]|nr:DUF3108 domain-containing protein [Alphaproteobacteria bacterium]